MTKQKFNLKEAREGLKYILMDKSFTGFGLDEDVVKSIIHLVKTSDKEFINRLRIEIINGISNEEKFKIINKLAGEK